MNNLKLSLCILLISTTLMAQHSAELAEESSHENGKHIVSHGKNMIAIDYGIDHIKEGVDLGDWIIIKKKWV